MCDKNVISEVGKMVVKVKPKPISKDLLVMNELYEYNQ